MTDNITNRNKHIVQQMYKEVLADWNLSVVDKYISQDFFSHDWPQGSLSGPQPFLDFYENVILAVVPDARYEVDDIIGEGDKVVVRWRLLGTHKGKFLDIAPTHKLITLQGIAIYRLENSQIAERWVMTDLYGLLQRLKASSQENVVSVH